MTIHFAFTDLCLNRVPVWVLCRSGRVKIISTALTGKTIVLANVMKQGSND